MASSLTTIAPPAIASASRSSSFVDCGAVPTPCGACSNDDDRKTRMTKAEASAAVSASALVAALEGAACATCGVADGRRGSGTALYDELRADGVHVAALPRRGDADWDATIDGMLAMQQLCYRAEYRETRAVVEDNLDHYVDAVVRRLPACRAGEAPVVSGVRLVDDATGEMLGYTFFHPGRLGLVQALEGGDQAVDLALYREARECGETYAGAAAAATTVDEELSAANADCVYVHDVSVHPKCRGRGLAKLLIGAIRKTAVAWRLPALALVAVDGADKFWAAQGFEPRRVIDYGGAPAVYMSSVGAIAIVHASRRAAAIAASAAAASATSSTASMSDLLGRCASSASASTSSMGSPLSNAISASDADSDADDDVQVDDDTDEEAADSDDDLDDGADDDGSDADEDLQDVEDE